MSTVLNGTPAVEPDLAEPVDETHPSTWGPETDEFVWQTNPFHNPSTEEIDFLDWKDEDVARSHLDVSEVLPLPEFLDRQEDFYRGWRNPIGNVLAGAMARLALIARLTSATTAAELEARMELLEQQVRDDAEQRGFEAARTEFLSRPPAGATYAFGHMA